MQDVILRQSPADQQHYRATGVWPDETFADVLRARTAAHPDREAVTDGKARLTYRQLEDAIIRVADLLARSGIRPGDIVAVQLPNWIEFIPAYFAIERIGAIGVPVSIEFRAREVDYVLRTTGARGIITCAEYKKFDHQAMVHALRKDLPELAFVGVVRGQPTGDAVALDPVISASGGPRALPRSGPTRTR